MRAPRYLFSPGNMLRVKADVLGRNNICKFNLRRKMGGHNEYWIVDTWWLESLVEKYGAVEPAVDPDLISILIKKLTPEPTAIHNAVCGFVTSSGQFIRSNGPCHGFMCRAQKAQMMFSVYMTKSGYANKVSDPEHRAMWLDYLTTGPWKQLFPTEPNIVDGVDINSKDFRLKHGFIITDLAVPSNFLVNALIATRHPAEYPQLVATWAKLVQGGVDPSLAHFYAGVFAEQPDELYSIVPISSAHWSLNYDGREEYIRNFMRGKQSCPTDLYTKNKYYTPCNEIWGKGVAYDYKDGKYCYPGSYSEHIKTLLPKAEAKVGAFGQANNVTSCTLTQLIDICKSEEKRLVN